MLNINVSVSEFLQRKDKEDTRFNFAYASLLGITPGIQFFDMAYMPCADMRGAYLQGSIMRNTKLQKALLDGVHLEHAILIHTILDQSTLNDATLAGANLYGTSFREANMYRVHGIHKTRELEYAFFKNTNGLSSAQQQEITRRRNAIKLFK